MIRITYPPTLLNMLDSHGCIVWKRTWKLGFHFQFSFILFLLFCFFVVYRGKPSSTTISPYDIVHVHVLHIYILLDTWKTSETSTWISTRFFMSGDFVCFGFQGDSKGLIRERLEVKKLLLRKNIRQRV